MRLLSVLNERERRRLETLREKWITERNKKNYVTADSLRTQLEAAGCLPPDYTQWHPVFESCASRVDRAASRYVYGEP